MMRGPRTGRPRLLSMVLASVWMTAVEASCPEDFCIDWATIDAGGGLASQSDDQQWTVSGTVAQPDASAGLALVSGRWRLTGGFWSLATPKLQDQAFEDRFEGPLRRQGDSNRSRKKPSR